MTESSIGWKTTWVLCAHTIDDWHVQCS